MLRTTRETVDRRRQIAWGGALVVFVSMAFATRGEPQFYQYGGCGDCNTTYFGTVSHYFIPNTACYPYLYCCSFSFQCHACSPTNCHTNSGVASCDDSPHAACYLAQQVWDSAQVALASGDLSSLGNLVDTHGRYVSYNVARHALQFRNCDGKLVGNMSIHNVVLAAKLRSSLGRQARRPTVRERAGP
jgi:hypothetical protein